MYAIKTMDSSPPGTSNPWLWQRCPLSTCCQKTEALAPEAVFPEFFSNPGKFFLDQPAAGAFIGVDKLADFGIGVRSEQNMDMIPIMIPLHYRDIVIRRDVFKDFSFVRSKCVIEKQACGI